MSELMSDADLRAKSDEIQERLRERENRRLVEEAKRKIRNNPEIFDPQPAPEPSHPAAASFLPSGANTGQTWTGGDSGAVTPNNLP